MLLTPVIPAKAGIQSFFLIYEEKQKALYFNYSALRG
jgi:hypothetical protein